MVMTRLAALQIWNFLMKNRKSLNNGLIWTDQIHCFIMPTNQMFRLSKLICVYLCHISTQGSPL